MSEIVPAIPKLRAFVHARFATATAAAAELKEPLSSFTAWFSGAQKPGAAKRAKIAAWTGGEVTEPEWLTGAERREIARLTRVAARRAAAAGEGVAK